uniref:SDR family oxidoreductase n=1 Tax=Thaumasiovibrio occultus TaxID=1891184 RepID=UPI000B354ED9|nr:SDR family oxidoreductase [Thaumasiovibrio occultus]
MRRTVLITGANRGIGLALCKEYMLRKWQIVSLCRNKETSSELLELAHLYPDLSVHFTDLTDYLTVNRVMAQLPVSQLDVVIANAGYYGPKIKQFGQTDVEEWRKVFETNAIAPLKLVEAAYPLLKKSNAPKVVTISSKVGSMTENTSGGGYIYRSSKAALNSVTKSLHNDLHPQNFCCVALHPGWVQTEMGGPNALLPAEQSAKGLIDVIDDLTSSDSGKFLNYNGTEIPW